jgi:hypothetical protein
MIIAVGATICLVILIPALAARADLAWDETTTVTLKLKDAEKRMSSEKQSYSLKGTVVRIDHIGRSGATFYNFHNRAAVMVNFPQRTFISVSLTEWIIQKRQDREKIKRELPKMEATIERQEGEMREITAAQLEAQKIKYRLWAKPYSVRPTGERAEIAGHNCVKYEGLSGDTVFQEIWVAEDIELESQYKSHFASGMARLDPQQHSHLTRVSGFPVKVVSRYGPVTVTTEVTHITDSKIPADAFIFPDDLKESPYLNRPPQ